MTLGRDLCGNWDEAVRREWLVANGLGGYACGTVALANTRRYHAFLMASLAPPVERTLLVAKVEVSVDYLGRRYALTSNEFADGTVDPRGFVRHRVLRRRGRHPGLALRARGRPAGTAHFHGPGRERELSHARIEARLRGRPDRAQTAGGLSGNACPRAGRPRVRRRGACGRLHRARLRGSAAVPSGGGPRRLHRGERVVLEIPPSGGSGSGTRRARGSIRTRRIPRGDPARHAAHVHGERGAIGARGARPGGARAARALEGLEGGAAGGRAGLDRDPGHGVGSISRPARRRGGAPTASSQASPGSPIGAATP